LFGVGGLISDRVEPVELVFLFFLWGLGFLLDNSFLRVDTISFRGFNTFRGGGKKKKRKKGGKKRRRRRRGSVG